MKRRLARCALIDWMSRPRPPVSTQVRIAAGPAVMRGGSPSSPGSSGSTCSTDRSVGSAPKVASRGAAPGAASAIALFVVPKSSPSTGPLPAGPGLLAHQDVRGAHAAAAHHVAEPGSRVRHLALARLAA